MERKRFFVIGILLVFMLIIRASYAKEIVTSINITNGPPILKEFIPNQSWAVGSNITGALDLDDYFVDPNGDNISFSYSPVENVTVLIDSSNIVSFYSDPSFIGTKNITFYASDFQYTTDSNLVFLFVGTDTEPPLWHDPAKNKVNVYQSSYVNFTTSWTDNVWLSSYYFTVNQGSGWINSPQVLFSGTSNISRYELQVIAGPGTVVFWGFCAMDSTGNSNCTEIQNFTVLQRDIPSVPYTTVPGTTTTASSPMGEGVFRAITRMFRQKRLSNFTVEPDYFRISLKQGETETRVLRITNIGDTNLSFNISTYDLEEMIYLSDHEIIIQSGQSKEVTVDFYANLNASPSQYFGFIGIFSIDSKFVPVIIDINPRILGFSMDLEVPKKYKQVMPGDSVYANISLLNLKDIVDTNMTLYYALKDFYGNIYDSLEEKFVFNSSLFFSRNLSVPDFAREGDYIFYARAYCEEGLTIDSDSFEVGFRSLFLSSLRSSLFFVLIFFLCLVALILMVIYSRSKEKERILSLYLLLNELKNLVKEEKFDDAVELYIRIKRFYGERVSTFALQDKNQLKEEIKQLALRLKAGENKAQIINKDKSAERGKQAEPEKNEAAEENKDPIPDDGTQIKNSENGEV